MVNRSMKDRRTDRLREAMQGPGYIKEELCYPINLFLKELWNIYMAILLETVNQSSKFRKNLMHFIASICRIISGSERHMMLIT